MQPDDELCLCFHVSLRKVVNFLRVERPRRVGQLSDCFGAGTGCGWCRPFLQRLFDQAQTAEGRAELSARLHELPPAALYAASRQEHLRARQSGESQEPRTDE